MGSHRLYFMEKREDGLYRSTTQELFSNELTSSMEVRQFETELENMGRDFFDELHEFRIRIKNTPMDSVFAFDRILRGEDDAELLDGAEESQTYSPDEIRLEIAREKSRHRYWANFTGEVRIILYDSSLSIKDDNFQGYAIVENNLYSFGERRFFYGTIEQILDSSLTIQYGRVWQIFDERINPVQEGFFYGTPLTDSESERLRSGDTSFLEGHINRPRTHLFSRVLDGWEDIYKGKIERMYEICDHAEKHGYRLLPMYW